MKLMTESIYIGHDMKRFNEIRDALDLAKIPYKHKVRNQDSEWFFSGKRNEEIPIWKYRSRSG